MDSIIVDLGSGFTKAGFQSSDAPTVVIPSFIGKPRDRYADQFEPDSLFVGDDAVQYRDKLTITNAIEHGYAEWPEVESVLAYVFEVGLGCDPAGQSVLVTEPAVSADSHRESLAESLFEVFDVEELNISIQGILSLYATGQKTGLVVEIGDGVTQVIPVHEGYTNRSAIMRSDFAGTEITMYLQKLLCDAGCMVTTRDDMEHVRMVKEQYCYLTLDFLEEDAKEDLEVTYELPDGMTLNSGETSITLGKERFYCPEILFDPRTVKRDNMPLHELVWKSVELTSIELRKAILHNVVVSGGTSMITNFPERLEAELRYMAPKQGRSNVKVSADENRLFGVWYGAKVFCKSTESTSQRKLWVTKSQYFERGPSVVHTMNPFSQT